MGKQERLLQVKLKVKVLKPFKYSTGTSTSKIAKAGEKIWIDRTIYEGLAKGQFIEKKIISEDRKERIENL